VRTDPASVHCRDHSKRVAPRNATASWVVWPPARAYFRDRWDSELRRRGLPELMKGSSIRFRYAAAVRADMRSPLLSSRHLISTRLFHPGQVFFCHCFVGRGAWDKLDVRSITSNASMSVSYPSFELPVPGHHGPPAIQSRSNPVAAGHRSMNQCVHESPSEFVCQTCCPIRSGSGQYLGFKAGEGVYDGTQPLHWGNPGNRHAPAKERSRLLVG
jgi:hypothetical protein